MRGVALSILLLVGSCAPDYAHSAFRCDARHGCPDDQTCVLARCRRPPDGVVCGEATCNAMEKCCIDTINAPRCIAVGDVCPGTSAQCDGLEDCQAGDQCCADDSTVVCKASCGRFACRDDAGCPSTAPNCCSATATTWGECSLFSC